MTVAESASDLSILLRLMKEARPYNWHLCVLLLLDLLATPLAMLSPLAMKVVVDSVLDDQPLPIFLGWVLPSSMQSSPQALLVFAALLLIAVTALIQIQRMAESLLGTYVGGRITLDFRSKLFWSAQQLSLAFHDLKGVTHSLFRVQYDSMAIRWVAIDGLISISSALVGLLAMIAVISLINPTLAAVALIVVPLLAYLIVSYRRPLRRGWDRQLELSNQAMGVINEVFSALRVVKAFSQEEQERSRFVSKAGQSLRAQVKVTLLQDSFGVMTGVITAIGTGTVLYVGTQAILSGEMTMGDLLVVMAYLALLYGPLQVIGQQSAELQNSLAAATRAFEILDERADVPEARHPRRIERAKGEFCVQGLDFGYEPGHNVLQHTSFVVPAGAKVGIAGETGAGKTTLISLLLRFFDPTDGRILLDGIDLRDYQLADLRRQYGVVLQEPVLFSTTIADNIAYGRKPRSEDEIIEAAKRANAHEFIQALPNGYDTLVGERGMRLSGGQRQRVSIARAFLRDAPILLLDEPTSSVDPKTENAIMDAMARLMEGRTTFLIAHRMSTLEHCDLLFEVKDGKVLPTTLDALKANAARSQEET